MTWPQIEALPGAMAGFARAHDGQGRKAFDVPMARGSDDAEWTQLDKLSMAQWMETQGYTSPRLKWLVDYACRDDYGTTADGVSAWTGIWYSLPRQTGDDRSEGYLSWPEGNGRLVAGLAAATGSERVKLQYLAHTVEPGEGGWNVAPRADAATQAPRCAPREAGGAGVPALRRGDTCWPPCEPGAARPRSTRSGGRRGWWRT